VIEEKKALDEKVAKLIEFLRIPSTVKTLHRYDLDLLLEQRATMLRYSDILAKRIADFDALPF